MRISVIFTALIAFASVSGETETPKHDWNDPKVVLSFFDFAAKKYTWPKTVTKTTAECTSTENKMVFGALFEISAAVKDDMVKCFISSANLLGQAMVQGATLDKAGVIFKTPDGKMATVLMPPADLKKLGSESSKGPKADKAVLSKMVGELVKKCDWKEVDALIKPAEKSKTEDKPAK